MGDRLLTLLITALGIFAWGVYGWAVLMPDNHSLMVGFPWFYVVQGGFLCGVLWAIAELWRQRSETFPGLWWLGGGLDWVIFSLITTLSLSLITSQFTEMSVLYVSADLALIGILYGLHHYWLRIISPEKSLLKHFLLGAQGLLCVAFSVWSLILWAKDTVLPELTRLAGLKELGLETSYRFSSVTLRNWATFGHPNYVAGFLLLAMPLLVSLAIAARNNWQKYFWVTGCVVSGVTFYTTNSRGGWLGLFATFIFLLYLLIQKSELPRRWLNFGGAGGLTFLLIWAIQNDRLRRTFTGIWSLGSQGGEFAYRWITVYTGWQMGLDQPLAGQGLGSTALLYQKFRPVWAGLEAEMLFQLHSTPMQIWAELGLLGVITMLLGIFLLGKMWLTLIQPETWLAIAPEDKILVSAIGAAGVGYGVMALTDYQLDVIAITGFLILYISLLTHLHHRYVTEVTALKPIFQPLTLGLIGLTLIGSLTWFCPINNAFATSHRAFSALRQDQIEPFVEQLAIAHDITPWQPYYAYQLGWSLGEVALWGNNPPDISRTLRDEAISWLQRAIAASPHFEFGHSSLGWLTLVDTPTVATGYFSEAMRLMPYHQLNLLGLGESWLQQGEPEKAIEAIALELVRFPALATSPMWLNPQWLSSYPMILQRTDEIFTELLKNTNPKNQKLQNWLRQNRGSLRWYYGNNLGADADFRATNFELGQLMLALNDTTPETWRDDLTPEQIQTLETAIDNNESWALAIAAWQNPNESRSYLKKSLRLKHTNEILNDLHQNLRESSTLWDWVHQQQPQQMNRIQRQGFNVISRHLGGNQPSDFRAYSDNTAIARCFSNLFTIIRYAPELDLQLSEYWQPLLVPSPSPKKSSD